MPETIRTANERLRSRPRRGGVLAAFVVVQFSVALSTPAQAEAGFASAMLDALNGALTGQQILALTLTLGLLCFAVLATIVLMRTRKAADRILELRVSPVQLTEDLTDPHKTILTGRNFKIGPVTIAAVADQNTNRQSPSNFSFICNLQNRVVA